MKKITCHPLIIPNYKRFGKLILSAPKMIIILLLKFLPVCDRKLFPDRTPNHCFSVTIINYQAALITIALEES